MITKEQEWQKVQADLRLQSYHAANPPTSTNAPGDKIRRGRDVYDWVMGGQAPEVKPTTEVT